MTVVAQKWNISGIVVFGIDTVKGFSKRPGISQRVFFSTLWLLKVLVFI